MKTNEAVHILLLVLVCLTWAGSFIAVRLTYKEVSPMLLGFFRFVVATPVMIAIVLLRRKCFFLPRKELSHVIVLGLTGVTLIYIFQFNGIAFTTASTSSVLINTNVLMIAILSGIFLKEPFHRNKILGIMLSFTGVVLVVFGQMTNEAINVDTLFLTGCIFILCSALCWAVYSIIGKKLLETYDPLQVTANAFLAGLICYIPFALPELLSTDLIFSYSGLIAILYLSLFCSVFAYVAWYVVLAKQEAARSAVFLTLIPLFTIILSFFIGEYPTPLFFIGAILIMYGVYLTQKKRKIILN